MAVCHSLGLPPHPNKCIGPSTCLVVLGIELDSLDQAARLPAEKLVASQELSQSWQTRWWCNRRQLESLIVHLHHAAKVVWPGRTFCSVSWISCATSAIAIILFVSALNFSWICSGGMIFGQHDMEWAFGYSQRCPLPQMWKLWHQMWQAPWALGHITIIMNGSLVPGCLHRQTSPSLTRNCFLWW